MTKKQMIAYIQGFDLYPTMNSWNNSNGYSFNVKVHSLPLTGEEKDKLYDIISDEDLSSEFYLDCDSVIRDHENEINAYWDTRRSDPLQHITELYPEKRYKTRCDYCHRGTWYENGECRACSKGTLQPIRYNEQWLEWLSKRQFEIAFNGRSGGHLVLYKWNGYNHTGTGWNHDYNELEEMSRDDVLRIYRVLRIFDRCYRALLKLAKEYASYEVKEVSEKVETTVNKRIFAI